MNHKSAIKNVKIVNNLHELIKTYTVKELHIKVLFATIENNFTIQIKNLEGTL